MITITNNLGHLAAVYKAVGADVRGGRPALTGALFDFANNRIVATDGCILNIWNQPDMTHDESDNQIIILPRKAVTALANAEKKYTSRNRVYEGTRAVFDNGVISIYLDSANGEELLHAEAYKVVHRDYSFPDYESVIGHGNTHGTNPPCVRISPAYLKTIGEVAKFLDAAAIINDPDALENAPQGRACNLVTYSGKPDFATIVMSVHLGEADFPTLDWVRPFLMDRVKREAARLFTPKANGNAPHIVNLTGAGVYTEAHAEYERERLASEAVNEIAPVYLTRKGRYKEARALADATGDYFTKPWEARFEAIKGFPVELDGDPAMKAVVDIIKHYKYNEGHNTIGSYCRLLYLVGEVFKRTLECDLEPEHDLIRDIDLLDLEATMGIAA